MEKYVVCVLLWDIGVDMVGWNEKNQPQNRGPPEDKAGREGGQGGSPALIQPQGSSLLPTLLHCAYCLLPIYPIHLLPIYPIAYCLLLPIAAGYATLCSMHLRIGGRGGSCTVDWSFVVRGLILVCICMFVYCILAKVEAAAGRCRR